MENWDLHKERFIIDFKPAGYCFYWGVTCKHKRHRKKQPLNENDKTF